MDKDMSKQKMPSGIPYIVGNEAAERFSYYGMKAILTVFMIDFLRMPENQSTEWLHTFGSAVYLLPIAGAFLSDFVLGKYKTILSLSIVYCLGHLVLALFETQEGLAIGLGLIAIGSGGIKPCVSAHVGDQFNDSNKNLLPTVFNYFYLAINFGSFISSLATPLLLQYLGPSIAFGIPGGLMLLATFLFWLGRNDFVHIKPFGKNFIKVLFSKEGLLSIGKLSVIYLFVAFFWSLYDQTASTWVTQSKSIFMDKSINLLGWNFTILPSQIGSINPILILILVPIFTILIYPYLKKITALRKITIGMIITSVSFIVIGLAEDKIFTGTTVSVHYQFLAYLIITIGEVLVSITALEFSYSQAPNELKSFIMSLFLFSVSLGNGIIIGVNHLNTQEVSVSNIESLPNKTVVHVSDINQYHHGEKFNISSNTGLKTIQQNDTLAISGTYLVGNFNVNESTFTLWNLDRTEIKCFGTFQNDTKIEFSVFKLKGGNYFYFFACMLAIVGVLFIFVAETYKGKTYIQSENSRG